MVVPTAHGFRALFFRERMRQAYGHRESSDIGVHDVGERVTEIIHIGQAVMAFGGTIEYFRDSVFNYPTLAEAYKVAAFDGLNRL